MRSADDRTGTLNSLLRGELSAVETYSQALDKVGSEPGAADLRQIEADHQRAVELLHRHIAERGGIPPMSSGAWGTWAATVEATAKLFGNTAALKALKEGEEHGIKQYEDALEDANLDAECKTLIRNTLLPQTRAHVPVLDRLMGQI
jgi:hypothetical protein